MRPQLPNRRAIESTVAGLTSTEASRTWGPDSAKRLKASDSVSITLATWAFRSMRIAVR